MSAIAVKVLLQPQPNLVIKEAVKSTDAGVEPAELVGVIKSPSKYNFNPSVIVAPAD